MNIEEIKSVNWQVKTGETGGIVEGTDDIAQCIEIILGTPKGSVPMRPDFGSDIYKYVDYPQGAAIPHIVAETIDALEKWEKRIKIKKVLVFAENDRLFVDLEYVANNQKYNSKVIL